MLMTISSDHKTDGRSIQAKSVHLTHPNRAGTSVLAVDRKSLIELEC